MLNIKYQRYEAFSLICFDIRLQWMGNNRIHCTSLLLFHVKIIYLIRNICICIHTHVHTFHIDWFGDCMIRIILVVICGFYILAFHNIECTHLWWLVGLSIPSYILLIATIRYNLFWDTRYTCNIMFLLFLRLMVYISF